MFLSALDSGEEQKIAANCAAMRSRRNIGYRNLFRTKTCPHVEGKPAARKTSQPQKTQLNGSSVTCLREAEERLKCKSQVN